MSQLHVQPFFDEDTFSYSYVIWDGESLNGAIIDPVYNYEPSACRLHATAADAVIEFVRQHQLSVQWILETHVHADHLSAATYLREHLGGQVGIGAEVTKVQCLFGRIFNFGPELARDGSQFDRLLQDGDELPMGNLHIQVLATPGHTPACVSYQVDDAVFVGDTLFMPDYGTARADFPGADAATLYRSIESLLALPPETRLFMCHDYGTATRKTFQHVTTVAAQRAENIHIAGKSCAEYVEYRQCRDAQLATPRLLYPAVQFNMHAGQLPAEEANGQAYFKLPIHV